MCSDGQVAVTTHKPVICILTATPTLTLTHRIQTRRQYDGIAGLSGGRLIASCIKRGNEPASVDIVTRQGDLVTTVTDSSRLPGLVSPLYLCVTSDNHVLVSDWDAQKVFMVDLSSGQVTHTHQHTDMKHPRQVCVDSAGQLYVASDGGGCVLVRDRAGQWRPLLTASDRSDPGYDVPGALCVTGSGQLVVGWWKTLSDSVLIGYRFN